MDPQIIAAVFGLIGVIISVFVSARTTQDKVTHKLETQNEIQNTKIEQLSTEIANVKTELKDKIDSNRVLEETKINNINNSLDTLKQDIKEHNHYAQLFNENIPVLKEKMKVENHRMDDIEAELKELSRKVYDK